MREPRPLTRRFFWATAPFTEARALEMRIAEERGLELYEGKLIEVAGLALLGKNADKLFEPEFSRAKQKEMKADGTAKT